MDESGLTVVPITQLYLEGLWKRRAGRDQVRDKFYLLYE
jgi:hypothetical protein